MWSSSRPGLLEYLMETRCAPPPPLRTTSTLSHLVHRPRGQEIHAPWYGQIPRPKIYIYINHTSAVITCQSASFLILQLQIGGSVVPKSGINTE